MISRIEVIGEETFNPREWLRREVLWASLMAPYSVQLAGFLDDGITEKAQHASNLSRQILYGSQDYVEAQSIGFFNQGKNVAGLISGAVLFRALRSRSGDGAHVNPLALQASSVDMVLATMNDEASKAEALPDDEAFSECARLAQLVVSAEPGQFGITQRLLRATSIMSALACQEAAAWVAASWQDEGRSQPILTIHNGGHPRSGGPRVAMLQPIFHDILGSDEYNALSACTDSTF